MGPVILTVCRKVARLTIPRRAFGSGGGDFFVPTDGIDRKSNAAWTQHHKHPAVKLLCRDGDARKPGRETANHFEAIDPARKSQISFPHLLSHYSGKT